jgi:hypothetical protein
MIKGNARQPAESVDSPAYQRSCYCDHLGPSIAFEKDFVSWWACLGDMEGIMELRHLRYFIAVAEEGSLTLAAEKGCTRRSLR